MEIFGLPAHVLVVHGAVVLAPFAAFAVIVFAIVPKWRYLTRWPAAALAVAAAGVVWTARITGNDFFDDRFAALPAGNPIRGAIEDHQAYGDILSWVIIAFLVLTLLGAWLLGGPSGFASGAGERPRGETWVETVVPASLVVVSIVVLIYVFLTGDAGARAVWDPPTS
jgi:hypothetical protein